MSWSQICTASLTWQGNAGVKDIAWSTTPSVGDLAVVAWCDAGQSDITAAYIRTYGSTDSGTNWADGPARIYVNDNQDCCVLLRYKILDANDLVGYRAYGPTGNSGHSLISAAFVLRGAAYNDLHEVTATASSQNSSAANPPAATTSNDGCAVFALWFASVGNGSASVPTIASPFDTNAMRTTTTAGTTYDGDAAFSYVVQTSSGSIDPAVWSGPSTSTSNSWVGITIAFNVGTDTVTTQSTGVALSGTLAVAGDVEWETEEVVAQSSGVALSGTLAIAGDVEWETGDVEVTQSVGPALSGTLTVEGDVEWETEEEVAQSTGPALSGTLALAGDVELELGVAQSTGPALSGTLTLAGDVELETAEEVAQSSGVALSGALTLAGDVELETAEEVAQSSGVALSGTLALAGDVVWEEGTTAAATTGWMPPKPAKKRAKKVYHIDEDPEPEPEVIEAPEIVTTAPDPAVYQSALALALAKAKAAPRSPLRPSEVAEVEKRLAPARQEMERQAAMQREAERRAAQDEEEAILALLLVL